MFWATWQWKVTCAPISNRKQPLIRPSMPLPLPSHPQHAAQVLEHIGLHGKATVLRMEEASVLGPPLLWATPAYSTLQPHGVPRWPPHSQATALPSARNKLTPGVCLACSLPSFRLGLFWPPHLVMKPALTPNLSSVTHLYIFLVWRTSHLRYLMDLFTFQLPHPTPTY